MKIYCRLFLIIICLLLIFPIDVYAAGYGSILGNDIVVSDSYQTVPVYIKNNPGIMGYKISFEYPEDVEIKSVNRGVMCSDGLFETTLENHTKNIIDVVWNTNENISSDGSVFIICLKATAISAGEKIKLTYSQDDTFNEAWEDVELSCGSINIISANQEGNDNSEEVISSNNYSYIKTVIDTELENYNAETIDDINESDENEFISSVSKQLGTMPTNEISEIKNLYNDSVKNEFVSGLETFVDAETIETIISESLKNIKVNDINELNNKLYRKFNESVINKIKEVYPEYDKDFEKLNDKEQYNAIREIYNKIKSKEISNPETTTQDIHKKNNNNINDNKKCFYIIISASFVVALLFIIFMFVKKNKKASGKNEKNTIDNSGNSDSHN